MMHVDTIDMLWKEFDWNLPSCVKTDQLWINKLQTFVQSLKSHALVLCEETYYIFQIIDSKGYHYLNSTGRVIRNYNVIQFLCQSFPVIFLINALVKWVNGEMGQAKGPYHSLVPCHWPLYNTGSKIDAAVPESVTSGPLLFELANSE